MSETLQRYRISRTQVSDAGYRAVTLVPDDAGEAVLHADAQRRIEELEEALRGLLDATPQEQCDQDCDDSNCPWKQARAALRK